MLCEHVLYIQAQSRMAGLLQPYTVCPAKELCFTKACTLSHPPLHYRRPYIEGEFEWSQDTGLVRSQYGHYLVDRTALEPLHVIPAKQKGGKGRKKLQWLYPTVTEQAAIDVFLQAPNSEHSTPRCATNSLCILRCCTAQ
jgi:hypothetical protein